MTGPTLAALVAALEYRLGDTLADVGLFLDGPGGSTVAVAEGLRRGLAAVGVEPGSAGGPLVDADFAELSAAAALRVQDEAERSVLTRARARWHVAARAAGQPEFAAPGVDALGGGWRGQERRQVEERLADLDAHLRAPYREPGPALVVNPPAATPWGGRAWIEPRAPWGW